MELLSELHAWIEKLSLTSLLIVGMLLLAGFYTGRGIRFVKLPSIIGFMIVGVLAGPSLLNILGSPTLEGLSFITEIALGFVALSIGLELKIGTLKQQGSGIVLIILLESLAAFFAVSAGVYLVTKDVVLALLFGAIAPASAPAGTVAVIDEYRARGSLTRALYAVVGFDDGFGIIIFGFASAFARSMLNVESGGPAATLSALIAKPFLEIGLSVGIGSVIAFVFCLPMHKISSQRDVFVLTFAFVLIATGICVRLRLSVILTNLILGIVAVNTQPEKVIRKIRTEITQALPLLFVLFFILAGAHLRLSLLPSLGLVGIVYILARSGGLVGGSWLGALLGRAEKKIRTYLGLGILSQAGVAIGLALVVGQRFAEFGARGSAIGSTVITTITASCIVFELVGPILTKYALTKAGEIPVNTGNRFHR
jgi:Kef-type K+ transport system membrane component KefB